MEKAENKDLPVVGLDLTGNFKEGDVMTSGYMHLEIDKDNSNENRKSETAIKSGHIETRFARFNEGM